MRRGDLQSPGCNPQEVAFSRLSRLNVAIAPGKASCLQKPTPEGLIKGFECPLEAGSRAISPASLRQDKVTNAPRETPCKNKLLYPFVEEQFLAAQCHHQRR